MDLLKYFSSTQQVQCKGVCAVSHSVNCHSQVTWLTDACHDSFTCDVTHSERAHAWVGTSRSKNISKKIGNPQGVAHIGVAWHGAVWLDVHLYILTYIYTQTHVLHTHTLTQSHTYISIHIHIQTYEHTSTRISPCTYIGKIVLERWYLSTECMCVLVESMCICASGCVRVYNISEQQKSWFWKDGPRALGLIDIFIRMYICVCGSEWVRVYTTSWSGAQGCN